MLILASASPRRHELLLAAGIEHLVRPVSISEVRRSEESPLDFVRRLAEEKAAAAMYGADDVVLGADTVVCVADKMFGKPADEEDARRMLRLLSGREHFVHTGIHLLAGSKRISDVATTRVTFIPLSEADINDYIATGEPWGKAGAYAIQGRASRFVSGICGCYHNVVGLPVAMVYGHLRELRGQIPVVS